MWQTPSKYWDNHRSCIVSLRRHVCDTHKSLFCFDWYILPFVTATRFISFLHRVWYKLLPSRLDWHTPRSCIVSPRRHAWRILHPSQHYSCIPRRCNRSLIGHRAWRKLFLFGWYIPQRYTVLPLYHVWYKKSSFTLGEDGASRKVTSLSPQPLSPMCPTNSSRHGIVGTSLEETAFLFTLYALVALIYGWDDFFLATDNFFFFSPCIFLLREEL